MCKIHIFRSFQIINNNNKGESGFYFRTIRHCYIGDESENDKKKKKNKIAKNNIM